MLRKLVLIFVLLVVFFGFLDKSANACTSPSQCTCDPSLCAGSCTADCEVVYPNPNGQCYSTCQVNLGSQCTSWTGWGPCSCGWQENYCNDGVHNEMKIRACGALHQRRHQVLFRGQYMTTSMATVRDLPADL